MYRTLEVLTNPIGFGPLLAYVLLFFSGGTLMGVIERALETINLSDWVRQGRYYKITATIKLTTAGAIPAIALWPLLTDLDDVSLRPFGMCGRRYQSFSSGSVRS